MGDTGDELNRTFDAKFDRSQPAQVEPAGLAVGSAVEFGEQADHLVQIRFDE